MPTLAKPGLTQGQQFLHDHYIQLFWEPPVPDTSFAGRTVIVTGANVGLGKFAAGHFARLGAARVILGSRSLSRGEAAIMELEAVYPGVVHVCEAWALDLTSYESVKEFAARAARLDRLDHVVLNAGVSIQHFTEAAGNELSVTVNVVSTFLLALLLLPTLRRQSDAVAAAAGKGVGARPIPSLTITGTSYHLSARFPEKDAPDILGAMNQPDNPNMLERYASSKQVQLLALRELAERTAGSRQPVVINIVNPGLCKTNLDRNMGIALKAFMAVWRRIFAWEAEVGSRTLVHGAVAGPESHGVLLSECSLWNDSLGDFVPSEHGRKVQKKIWEELVAKLEAIEPGVTKIVD